MAHRGRLELALGRALRSAVITPADSAVVDLARHYARAIDGDDYPLWRIGPRFLDTLVELGLTPKVRAALLKSAEPEREAVDPIDELRAKRQQRRFSE